MVTNLLKDFEKRLTSPNSFIDYLKLFDLKTFEEELFKVFKGLYRDICEFFLGLFCNSPYFKTCSKEKQKELGAGKMKPRKLSLRICTGDTISFKSGYLSKMPSETRGDRQVFHHYFDTVSGCSPSYISRVAQQSVMAPSFEISTELLKGVGVDSPVSTARRLSLNFGKENLCQRVGLQLKKGENLEGKVVVISVDGGRSRTREYNGKKNKKGTHELYETPWKEPKLLVIHQIDKTTGKQSKEELPLYDCCYGDNACFELLGSYLKALKVEKAAHVQFVADGATWIWNRVEPFLVGLGVKKEKITQTLDYYHAMEHLGELIEKLPSTIETAQRVELREKCKELLWKGKVDEIINLIKVATKYKRKQKLLVREIKYFEKHKERCCYETFRNNKLLCGSGIVESGIRRVINLRFKGSASFWKIGNLEALIYLRAAFLSKRWETIWENRLLLKRGQI